jgi:hypothetical protein
MLAAMEAALFRMPGHARGLKLIRIGTILMLVQLAISLVMSIKALAASSPDDAMDAFKWIQYYLWANMAATIAMFVGSVLAIPDFRLARMSIHLVLIAALGFLVATIALWWSSHVISAAVAVLHDPDATSEDVVSMASDLGTLKFAAMVKDAAYCIGLISVIRTVRQSAVLNEQDALRDLASRVTGLIVLLLIADGFYQMTYGFGSGGVFPLLGLAVGLGLIGYWIYCHLRLQSFFESAAYFVNEPHHVPTVRLVSPGTVETDAPTPRPSSRSFLRESTAPSMPSAPVIVVAPELRAAPVPRAETSPGDESAEGPRFLR